jgi:hypothetical protein
MKSGTKSKLVRLDERPLAVGQRVIVVCKDCRCLGYRDKQGVWRGDADSKELRDVVGWIEDFV